MKFITLMIFTTRWVGSKTEQSLFEVAEMKGLHYPTVLIRSEDSAPVSSTSNINVFLTEEERINNSKKDYGY